MRISMNKLRLKWKVFAFLLGFCALLIVILWMFQTVFLDDFYRAIKVMEIKRNADTIAKNIDHDSISDLITMISENNDVSIEIMTLDGQSINFSRREGNNLPFSEKSALISYARENSDEYFEYVTIPPKPNMKSDFDDFESPHGNRQPEQSLMYVRIVTRASGDSVAILINSEITPVNATVTTLRYQLYFITGIMLLLSITLAFIIAKRVSRPIEEINKDAKVLASGNYDIYFKGKGFLEIGELSDTLNTAAVELNKVETLRRELMANISHDLRTPLSLIYSYAEMMHDFPDEITGEQTQTIMDETRRLTSLVNDVMDISKLETGIQYLNLSAFNLTGIIRATAERIDALAKNDGYQISFTYDEEVTVCADEIKITQAFYNLLINAINYTGADKAIAIRQTIYDGRVRIEVADTGEGITAENLPYIWDRYYKVDKKHKRAVTGTGLGLSIVKKIIELHGGDYGVESQIGKGSMFWFDLKL